MNFINSFINYLTGFFAASSRYNPIIPPKVRAEMNRLNISEPEIIGAFNSSDIISGKEPGSTCGRANYYGRVVGAVYKRDDNNRSEWVITACWVVDKHMRDPLTARKYGGGRSY